MKKPNPVKKNMDKFHKPKTHRDKTKYTRKGKVSDEKFKITYEDDDVLSEGDFAQLEELKEHVEEVSSES